MTGNCKGAILIATLIVLMFLAVLGMSLMVFLISRTAQTELQLNRLKAIYLAEAAVSKTIWELKLNKDVDGEGLGNIPMKQFGGGNCWATYDMENSIISAVGEINKIRRVLQVKFTQL